jgi:hypothetical protein
MINIIVSFLYTFWCPFCILPVCLGAPLRFNKILDLSKKKKKKNYSDTSGRKHRIQLQISPHM